LPELVIRVM